jgi:transcriptional regulator with XRE-family HTH domain
MTPFAKLIQQARESKGMTQQELAEAMEVSRGYIGQLETGLIKRPRTQYIALLEKHLGLTREEILRSQGQLGPQASTDLLVEIRRIARIPDVDDRVAELEQLSPELLDLIEDLAVEHVRRSFRPKKARS